MKYITNQNAKLIIKMKSNILLFQPPIFLDSHYHLVSSNYYTRFSPGNNGRTGIFKPTGAPYQPAKQHKLNAQHTPTNYAYQANIILCVTPRFPNINKYTEYQSFST